MDTIPSRLPASFRLLPPVPAQLPSRHPAAARPVAARLIFIDNIRWVMIMLVLSMHAAVTYSGHGSWYVKEPAKLGVRT